MTDTAPVSSRLLLRPADAGGIADLWHRGLDETSVGSGYVRAVDGLWLGSDLVPARSRGRPGPGATPSPSSRPPARSPARCGSG